MQLISFDRVLAQNDCGLNLNLPKGWDKVWNIEREDFGDILKKYGECMNKSKNCNFDSNSSFTFELSGKGNKVYDILSFNIQNGTCRIRKRSVQCTFKY